MNHGPGGGRSDEDLGVTDLDSDGVGLRVTISDLAPGVLCCALAGEVDLATGPRLAKELTEAMALRPCHLVVDLSEVTFLGSIGLQILTEINDRQQDVDQHLALVVADKRTVQRPLEITGLDEVLDVHHELQSATGACHAKSQGRGTGPAT
jgi:anti-sigma B factor antagonist